MKKRCFRLFAGLLALAVMMTYTVIWNPSQAKTTKSKDVKKVYTNCTAAVLRAKDCVMKTVSKVQENAEDIYAEAQQINEDRAAAEEAFEDTAEEETFKETEETAAEEE